MLFKSWWNEIPSLRCPQLLHDPWPSHLLQTHCGSIFAPWADGPTDCTTTLRRSSWKSSVWRRWREDQKTASRKSTNRLSNLKKPASRRYKSEKCRRTKIMLTDMCREQPVRNTATVRLTLVLMWVSSLSPSGCFEDSKRKNGGAQRRCFYADLKTRALLGADSAPPPCRIFSIAEKHQQNIDTKLSVPSPTGVHHPNFRKIRRDVFWENSVLVTSCSAILGQKEADVWRLLECTGLK